MGIGEAAYGTIAPPMLADFYPVSKISIDEDFLGSLFSLPSILASFRPSFLHSFISFFSFLYSSLVTPYFIFFLCFLSLRPSFPFCTPLFFPYLSSPFLCFPLLSIPFISFPFSSFPFRSLLFVPLHFFSLPYGSSSIPFLLLPFLTFPYPSFSDNVLLLRYKNVMLCTVHTTLRYLWEGPWDSG